MCLSFWGHASHHGDAVPPTAEIKIRLFPFSNCPSILQQMLSYHLFSSLVILCFPINNPKNLFFFPSFVFHSPLPHHTIIPNLWTSYSPSPRLWQQRQTVFGLLILLVLLSIAYRIEGTHQKVNEHCKYFFIVYCIHNHEAKTSCEDVVNTRGISCWLMELWEFFKGGHNWMI